MVDLWNAVQWLEGSFQDWQAIVTSPEFLAWSTSIALLLIFSIALPMIRRRRQAAALEWRKTLTARARA